MLNDKTILNTGGTGEYPGNGNMKLKSSLSPFIAPSPPPLGLRGGRGELLTKESISKISLSENLPSPLFAKESRKLSGLGKGRLGGIL